MEPINPTDIDNPLTRREVWIWYPRVRACELIHGKWFVHLEGFHDKICLGAVAEPPFERGDLVKFSIEKVVQYGRETV